MSDMTQYETGSLRKSQVEKSRIDLISPLFLMRLGYHMGRGIKEYAERNWELGQPTARLYSSACRHLAQWAIGLKDEDHLAAAAFNIMAIIHEEEMIKFGKMDPKFDDMTHYVETSDKIYK